MTSSPLLASKLDANSRPEGSFFFICVFCIRGVRNQETSQQKKNVRVGVVRAPHAQHASHAPGPWVNDKLGEWGDSATPECFVRGSQGTIFVRSSKISLFFPELCSFRRVICFPRFCKIWHQTFECCSFGFDDALELFWKLQSVTAGHLFANSDDDLDNLWKVPFFFSKQSRCYLPASCANLQDKESILVRVRLKLESKLHFRAWARASAEEPAIVVVIGTSRLRRSII